MGGLPGLLHVSCGKSEAVVDATEPFGDDTLAAYTHPPLDLSDEFDSDTLGTQWYPVGINTPPPSIWSVSWNERGSPNFVDVVFADGQVQLTGRNARGPPARPIRRGCRCAVANIDRPIRAVRSRPC